MTAALVLWLAVPCIDGRVLYAQPTGPAANQTPPPQPTGAPVIFSDETLLVLYDKVGPFTPEERALAVTERLARLAKDPFAKIYPVTAVDHGTTSELVYGEASEIVYGEMVVMTITDRDAEPTGMSRFETAKAYAEKIQAALAKNQDQVTIRTFLIDSGLALLDTVILVGLLILFHRTFPKIYDKIAGWRGTVIPALKIQRVEVLSSAQITAGLLGVAKAIRVGIVLVLLYIYLTTVLGIFPWTRGISAALFGAVLSTLRAIGQAFASYVPNVISIVIIVMVTRYIIKLIGLVFSGMQRGAISFSGFQSGIGRDRPTKSCGFS
ncbi:MAG: hypothetical protein HC794_02525 [Nitrospiraceae bacterium]|nr:hypothetical protein [Nitrospiraceae bacterium]